MTEKKKYIIAVVTFFVFASLFPTLRLLIMGNSGSETLAEFFLSSLPDLFAFAIVSTACIYFYRSKAVIKLTPFDWTVFIFWATNVVIGFIVANNFMISVYGFRMTYFPLCFYIIFRFLSSEQIEHSLSIIFKWFVFVGLIGIALYLFFFDQMLYMIHLGQEEAATYFVVRMSSIFWSPVVFSVFMAAAFLYFCHHFFKTGNWISFLFMAILFFCILMSVSRGTIVATAGSFLLMSLLMRKWNRSLYTLLMMIAVYFIAASYIASPSEFFDWILYSTMDTVSLKKGITRVDLWLNALDNFTVHPFGYGLGKAGHVAARFFSENSTEADIYSTDGWFLKLANETGIWGLISYLFMAIFYFILFLKKKVLLQKSSILIFFFCIFVMVNVQNIVSNVLDFYLFSFLYWALLGASVKVIQEHQLQ